MGKTDALTQNYSVEKVPQNFWRKAVIYLVTHLFPIYDVSTMY
jgi:hypothetical protein